MMSPTHQYGPESIDLSASQYTVKQTGKDSNMRPEYEASDGTGDIVFSGKYMMYEKKDEFRFVDADGTEAFAVTASGTWDIAGDYRLVDSHTGEALVILDNDFSIFQDTWRIRDADDGSLLAEINSRGGLVTVGRKVLPLGQWVGHQYEITDANGDAVGSIESDFAVFDEYEISITDSSSVPTEPLVIGAVVIDAIQAN